MGLQRRGTAVASAISGEGRLINDTRLDPRRIYQQVADDVRALIRGGQFGIGTRLPAERELAAQLGVSRPSLREALVALEIEGIVGIRPGAGVYVLSTADRWPGCMTVLARLIHRGGMGQER